jgi:tRNA(Ile2) C34 agmatinyltransferase TiaS
LLDLREAQMRIYVGFDDTDTLGADQGTGKVARWFEERLPEECRLGGVLRQQLLVNEGIPYTSHNSAACMIVDTPDPTTVMETLVAEAIAHLEIHSLEGSDPGVCVACEGAPSLARLIEFGHACTRQIVTQKQAIKAASEAHLSGHGGTNDGIIGAAAAVGLTASRWSGRFIEYGRLRDLPDVVSVSDLERSTMVVVSIDRDARIPAPGDLVYTKGWLRPRLWGDRAVVLVTPIEEGVWESVGEKRKNQRDGKENSAALPE